MKISRDGSIMDLKILCFILVAIFLLSFLVSKPKEHMGPSPKEPRNLGSEVSETSELRNLGSGVSKQMQTLRQPQVLNENTQDDSIYVATPSIARPTQRNLTTQYSNPYFSTKERNPVLAYQSSYEKGIVPANFGDPIRIPMISGPTGMYGEPSNFVGSLIHSRGSIPVENYENFGPFPGSFQGIPVPANSLKMTNENYNPGNFRFNPPPMARRADMQGTYIEPNIVPVVFPTGSNLPRQGNPSSGDFFRPYGPNIPLADVPFVGSLNSYAPFPEVNTPWEKSGILTSDRDNHILNLYRRPIAPAQDLWEYQVQDKDGFVIRLQNVKYVENGDYIPYIPGKSSLGPWKVHDFVQNKYVYV